MMKLNISPTFCALIAVPEPEPDRGKRRGAEDGDTHQLGHLVKIESRDRPHDQPAERQHDGGRDHPLHRADHHEFERHEPRRDRREQAVLDLVR